MRRVANRRVRLLVVARDTARIRAYLLSRVEMLTPTSPLTHMDRMNTARAVKTRKKAGVLRN